MYLEQSDQELNEQFQQLTSAQSALEHWQKTELRVILKEYDTALENAEIVAKNRIEREVDPPAITQPIVDEIDVSTENEEQVIVLRPQAEDMCPVSYTHLTLPTKA